MRNDNEKNEFMYIIPLLNLCLISDMLKKNKKN